MAPIIPPGGTPSGTPQGVPSDNGAGLAEIQAWAQFLNIDISASVKRYMELLQPDPDSMWNGSDQLGTVSKELLNTEQADLNQAGTDAASGMTGATADAFGQFQAELVGQVAGAGEAAQQLAGKIGEIATSFAESQHSVIAITGATATALGMLRA